MKQRLLKFAKWFLLAWGGVSLIAAVALTVFVVYWFEFSNRDKNDSAKPHDVRYALDACNFNSKQIEQVVHSHISSRSFTGDHLDAFAIKISQLDEADFIPKKDRPNEHWYRGDQLPPVLDAAVKLATEWHNEIPWFPTGAELRSADVNVFPIDFYCCCGSVEPTMARLAFVRKADRMLFYFDFKP